MSLKMKSLYSFEGAGFFAAFYGVIVTLIEGGKKGKGGTPYPSVRIIYGSLWLPNCSFSGLFDGFYLIYVYKKIQCVHTAKGGKNKFPGFFGNI